MTRSVLTLVLLLVFAIPSMAQHRSHSENKQPDIINMISDLSASQKKKLETLSIESKKRLCQLRKEQDRVRDSIESVINQKADMTHLLFPLLDREAYLQSEASKECYRTRVKISEILTPAQQEELQKKLDAKKKSSCHQKGSSCNKHKK